MANDRSAKESKKKTIYPPKVNRKIGIASGKKKIMCVQSQNIGLSMKSLLIL